MNISHINAVDTLRPSSTKNPVDHIFVKKDVVTGTPASTSNQNFTLFL